MLSYHDDWKLACGLEEEKIFGYCAHCDGEIYNGQEYYVVDDEKLHEDCIDGYVKENIAELKTAGE